MITEEQRRALFALREALRLCEGAGMAIDANAGESVRLWVGSDCKLAAEYLQADTVAQLLQEHPE